MNETLQTIHRRRSVRCFNAEPIAPAELQEILDAALCAPNAMNQQRWHFTVIQDQELLGRMVATIKQAILQSDNAFLAQRAAVPDYSTFYHAPTVILISGDEQAPWIQFDCAAAAENIALAAEALGVGSCIIESSAFLFAADAGSAFRQELGLREGYQHICTVALGYRAGEVPAMPPRNSDVVTYLR